MALQRGCGVLPGTPLPQKYPSARLIATVHSKRTKFMVFDINLTNCPLDCLRLFPDSILLPLPPPPPHLHMLERGRERVIIHGRIGRCSDLGGATFFKQQKCDFLLLLVDTNEEHLQYCNTAMKFTMYQWEKLGGGRCPPNLKLGGASRPPCPPPPPRFLRLYNWFVGLLRVVCVTKGTVHGKEDINKIYWNMTIIYTQRLTVKKNTQFL